MMTRFQFHIVPSSPKYKEPGEHNHVDHTQYFFQAKKKKKKTRQTTATTATINEDKSTSAPAAATTATAPAASATATATTAGVERGAEDRAGGQTTDRADGEPRGAGAEPAAAGPLLLLRRVRVGRLLLRRVAVGPRGRRRVALAVVVDVVVLPARLLGALRAPERRDRRHGHRRGHREEHDGHGAEVVSVLLRCRSREKTRPHHAASCLRAPGEAETMEARSRQRWKREEGEVREGRGRGR